MLSLSTCVRDIMIEYNGNCFYIVHLVGGIIIRKIIDFKSVMAYSSLIN